ncbi:E3 ubiquitin-protein ligase DTX4 [Microcaecilia unicolor]|uniref:E3 ubiquitin-protein ligase n=1 Tax=Microcaecilia unicolor TaxID=1415580 RepID=A0A6P7ZQR4_9AMPH|nr:E3 ubiquitin-protein ligase DTX4 [Microcaecilia unicolor]
MLLTSPVVVVWEWLNGLGRWRPYSPALSHYIEAMLEASPRVSSVLLGRVDEKLVSCVLDLQTMRQFRQDTGAVHPVQRRYYDPSSAPGKGVVWEWESDGGVWTPYDMEIIVFIQCAFEKQQSWIDLSSIGFCYIIDFTTMLQINHQTRQKRRLRWRQDLVYPLLTGSWPKLQSWLASPGIPSKPAPKQPCTCPQCLLVKNVMGSISPTTEAAVKGVSPTGPRHRSVAGIKTLVNDVVPAQSAQTIRSRKQTVVNQVNKEQATSVPAQTVVTTVTNPMEIKYKKSQNNRKSLSHNHLHCIAMAQSKALIAAGVPTLPVKKLNGSSPVNPALAGISGILMSAAGLPVCLIRPSKIILQPPVKSEINPIPDISSISCKTSKKQSRKSRKPEEIVKKYLQKVQSPLEENCSISMVKKATLYSEARTGEEAKLLRPCTTVARKSHPQGVQLRIHGKTSDISS